MKAYGTKEGHHKHECCDLRHGCGHNRARPNVDRVIKKRARRKAKRAIKENENE